MNTTTTNESEVIMPYIVTNSDGTVMNMVYYHYTCGELTFCGTFRDRTEALAKRDEWLRKGRKNGQH